MRTSLYVLLAALILSCSATQEETTEATTNTTESVSQDMSETKDTRDDTVKAAEAVNIRQSESTPETEVVSAKAPQAVTVESTNVELQASKEKTVRPSGPTLTETNANTVAATPSQPVVVEEDPVVAVKTQPDHAIWDNILRNFVSSTGQVNYSGLKASQSTLNSYLTELQNYPPQADWTRNQIMAYWINAYNAYTIKLIVDNYPVSSIMNLHGGKTWDRKWINIDGTTYSLNQIEHDILRARYGDARIHFAVNCAATSCPPIHNRAFTADNLNGTLQRLTRKFVNNPAYNTISSERIEISKIFEWYAGDFGNVTSYINGFTEVELGQQTQVSYKEYDWALNGK